MVSLTLSITDKFKKELQHFDWINWSKIAKEEIKKKIIFEKYMKTKKVSNRDWEFCEKIYWHPVDEFPIRKEYIEKLDRIRKEKSVRLKNIEDIFK